MTVPAALPWVLATRSAGKLRELHALFGGAGIHVVDLHEAAVPPLDDEEGIEHFASFEENALAKARYFALKLPGRVVVADDSGLVVRALGGQPGVFSKRWSGRRELSGPALDAANNEKLVAALAGEQDRRAAFVCVAALSAPHRELVTRGEVAGVIAVSASGRQGFGYDPYFFVPALGMTLAEASVSEKESVSHRGRAFESLLALARAEGLICTEN